MNIHQWLKALLLLFLPATIVWGISMEVVFADEVIHLQNGGRITARQVWRDGNMVMFTVPGGTIGIEKGAVKKIVQVRGSASALASPAMTSAPRKIEDKGSIPTPPASPVTLTVPPREKIDIASSLAKKKDLDARLEAALTEMRSAAGKGDETAKEEARLRARTISAEIYRLTDEVKAANDGKLPPGWW